MRGVAEGRRAGWSRWGWWAGRAVALGLIGGGVGTLLVLFTPLANVLAYPLLVEGPLAPADAIVVLGGGTAPDGSVSDTSLRRLTYGVRLYRRGYAQRLVLSTGVAFPGLLSESRVMLLTAVDMGVPASAILVEERSTRTVENAREVERLLQARGARTILLVTHPTHMRRAMGVFRRTSLTVRPAPTDGHEGHGTGAAERAQLFFKVGYEYAGLALYLWRGWL